MSVLKIRIEGQTGVPHSLASGVENAPCDPPMAFV